MTDLLKCGLHVGEKLPSVPVALLSVHPLAGQVADGRLVAALDAFGKRLVAVREVE